MGGHKGCYLRSLLPANSQETHKKLRLTFFWKPIFCSKKTLRRSSSNTNSDEANKERYVCVLAPAVGMSRGISRLRNSTYSIDSCPRRHCSYSTSHDGGAPKAWYSWDEG